MTKIEILKNAFVTFAQNEEVAKNEALMKKEQAQNDEEKREFKKLEQRAATHEKYNVLLSDMSEKALQLAVKLKIDAQALAAQSRELKKRSIAILEAIANSQRVTDKALDAVLQRLAAKSDKTLTIAQIQREMQHSTATQASYFKTCAAFYNFAQYSKADKSVTFDYDAIVLKSLLALYA